MGLQIRPKTAAKAYQAVGILECAKELSVDLVAQYGGKEIASIKFADGAEVKFDKPEPVKHESQLKGGRKPKPQTDGD